MFLEHAPLAYLIGVVAFVCACAVGVEWYRRARFLRQYPLFGAGCRGVTLEVVRGSLIVLGTVLSMAVVLGPRAKVVERVPLLEGLTVVASIDCSLSMLAPVSTLRFGERPQIRLDVVLESVHRLFEALADDKKGFACFAGHVFAAREATVDYARILKPLLQKIDRLYLEKIGKRTNFARAIEGCRRQFDLTEGARNVCLILSDGEPQGGDESDMRRELAREVAEIKGDIAQHHLSANFYVIMVGDPARFVRIPRFDENGNFAGFVIDPQTDEPARTRPDESYLKDIAEQVGGTFVRIDRPDDLLGILREIVNKERLLRAYTTRVVLSDISELIIITIIFLSLCVLFLPARVFRGRRKKQ